MATPLVSVIVPCFNYGHLLSETLESLLSQTYSSWECIIVDDGSTDDTRKVANQYQSNDNRFRYYYQDNIGLAGARNTGIRLARGDYLQFLDADDLLSANKLDFQLELLKANPNVDIVYGDVYLFNQGEGYKEAKQFKLNCTPVSGVGNTIIEALVEDNFFLVHCPLIRRGKINELRFKEDLNALEDWNFWFKCALLNCRFLYSTDVNNIVYVRGHGNNMSLDRRRMWYNKIRARKDIMFFMQRFCRKGKIDNVIDDIRKRHKRYMYLDLLRYHLMFGNIAKGVCATCIYALYSQKFYHAIYDASYWMKERIKTNLSM